MKLKGLRVLVLRPEHQADELSAALRARGAEPVAIPAVRITPPLDWGPVDDVLKRLREFDWLVFTSVNGVGMAVERAASLDLDPARVKAKIAAIGPATAQALEDKGMPVGWIPDAYTTTAMADQFPFIRSNWPGKVCLFRADLAGPELEERLIERGFQAERVDVYQTQSINAAEIAAAVSSVDLVVFTSASIVRSFASATEGRLPPALRILSIGPATSQACRRAGFTVHAEANDHTVQGLLDSLDA